MSSGPFFPYSHALCNIFFYDKNFAALSSGICANNSEYFRFATVNVPERCVKGMIINADDISVSLCFL